MHDYPRPVHGNDNARHPNSVDVRIGARLRALRHAECLSFEEFGNKLGITGNQLLKYEVGVNRIAAAKLYEFSRILNVPLAYFFATDGDGPDAHPDIPNEANGHVERPLAVATKQESLLRGEVGSPSAPREDDAAHAVVPFASPNLPAR